MGVTHARGVQARACRRTAVVVVELSLRASIWRGPLPALGIHVDPELLLAGNAALKHARRPEGRVAAHATGHARCSGREASDIGHSRCVERPLPRAPLRKQRKRNNGPIARRESRAARSMAFRVGGKKVHCLALTCHDAISDKKSFFFGAHDCM